MKTTASMDFSSYNHRRYGRPWLAIITEFSTTPTLQFLNAYNGDESGGEIVAVLEVGQVVKIGQKDYRKPRGGLNAFYRVTENGEFELIESAKEARSLWQAWRQSRASEDQ